MVQRFGFGFLRLSPHGFWSMTPREIFHALSFHTPPENTSINRVRLTALAKKYPDNLKGNPH